MKIALIGYGKMGKMVEEAAISQGHSIAAIVDPVVNGFFKNIASADLSSVDAAIEFTQPSSAPDNIIALAEKKIPTVTGTTGWYGRMDEVCRAVTAAGGALLWSSNFSIGVNLFYRIAWYAAELANEFPEYDISGFEAHHNKKLDSPSGTAKTLAEGVLARIRRKKKVVWETMNRRPEPDELHFPSMRMGSVPGRHSLFFDSPADTIEITHTARNREGFASGALRAAQWLAGRQGIYTIDDMLKNIGNI
ncbi:MAG: 4-hydroxy-tetrahydrodipicolinate reductase [Treponema sp.]|jgi:4-hydroxy-tetrahydrodipicolinate reductase|nr:4-hydroxy-tetrahydrodipicolinate reductase [Treponema sp.]